MSELETPFREENYIHYFFPRYNEKVLDPLQATLSIPSLCPVFTLKKLLLQ